MIYWVKHAHICMCIQFLVFEEQRYNPLHSFCLNACESYMIQYIYQLQLNLFNCSKLRLRKHIANTQKTQLKYMNIFILYKHLHISQYAMMYLSNSMKHRTTEAHPFSEKKLRLLSWIKRHLESVKVNCFQQTGIWRQKTY